MHLHSHPMPSLNPFVRVSVRTATHPRRLRANAAPRALEADPKPPSPPVPPRGPALTPPQTLGGSMSAPLSPPAHATEIDGTLSDPVGQAAVQVILRRGAPNLSREQLRRALPVLKVRVEGVDMPKLRAAAIRSWDALQASHCPVTEQLQHKQEFAEQATRYLSLFLRTPEGAALQAIQPLWQPWLAGCSPTRLREILAEATVTQREAPESAGL